MNTFEVYLYGLKKPTSVKADIFDMNENWITFYDNSVSSDVKIVAIFAAGDVRCVIRKDKQ